MLDTALHIGKHLFISLFCRLSPPVVNPCQHLLMLGATPGAEFEVVRIAPLGDPVEIRVRGSMISVRRDEAAIMEVSVD